MKWTGRVVVAVLPWVIFVAQPAHVRAQTSEPRLVVRTYNNSRIQQPILDAARERVAAALKAADIRIVWLDCWFGDRAGPDVNRCEAPRTEQEIVLRLHKPSSAAHPSTLGLGYSLVHLQGTFPFLATVFPERIASVARTSETSFPWLLGQVMAHEITHLLLDHEEHSQEGLMRAHWSRADLVDSSPSDWELRGEEIALMQAAAERRNMRPSRLFAMD